MTTLGEIGKILLTAVLTAIGSALAFKYKFIPEFRTTKRAESLEKQLSELYGPLKILIRRVRILSKSNDGELAAFHKHAHHENSRHVEQHSQLIEKHNQDFREIIIPAFEEMAKLISSKAHLAEPEMIGGFDSFYRFLKTWQDHLARPIGQRLPIQAATEIANENQEPREHFVLIEEQFEQ